MGALLGGKCNAIFITNSSLLLGKTVKPTIRNAKIKIIFHFIVATGLCFIVMRKTDSIIRSSS